MPIAEGKKAPACGFRDLWKELQRAGVVVLGISGDAPATHAKFATKSTVWIGRDGVVKKHWARVSNAAAHPEKVFEAVRGS